MISLEMLKNICCWRWVFWWCFILWFFYSNCHSCLSFDGETSHCVILNWWTHCYIWCFRLLFNRLVSWNQLLIHLTSSWCLLECVNDNPPFYPFNVRAFAHTFSAVEYSLTWVIQYRINICFSLISQLNLANYCPHKHKSSILFIHQ